MCKWSLSIYIYIPRFLVLVCWWVDLDSVWQPLLWVADNQRTNEGNNKPTNRPTKQPTNQPNILPVIPGSSSHCQLPKDCSTFVVIPAYTPINWPHSCHFRVHVSPGLVQPSRSATRCQGGDAMIPQVQDVAHTIHRIRDLLPAPRTSPRQLRGLDTYHVHRK